MYWGKRINIYELAKKAGVSTATISRVINNSPRVSEKTRSKILKLIEEEDYTPSDFARGLSGHSVKSVGVLTIDVRDPYYASVIHSLEQELSINKYNVILCNTGGEFDTQRNYISLLMQKKIDVLVLVGSVFRYKELKDVITSISAKIPVIIVNESVEGDNIYSILSNEEDGISELVRSLVDLGHENFVYVKSGSSYSARRKLKGFSKQIECQPVIEGIRGLEHAPQIVDEILRQKNSPTAIVCDEDIVALGVVQELSIRGYIVPKDFSVTGFNNHIYSKCSTPQITTIDSKSDEMGHAAGRLVLDVLSNSDTQKLHMMDTEVIIRGSSAVRKFNSE